MAVAEEDSSLFNEDNQENCSNTGSPCCSIEDVLKKWLLSDLQLSLLSSTSSTAAILNFFFWFCFDVFCAKFDGWIGGIIFHFWIICGTTTTIIIPWDFFRVWRLIFIIIKIHNCQQILNEGHSILYNILFSNNHWTTFHWSCIIHFNATLNRLILTQINDGSFSINSIITIFIIMTTSISCLICFFHLNIITDSCIL